MQGSIAVYTLLHQIREASQFTYWLAEQKTSTGFSRKVRIKWLKQNPANNAYAEELLETEFWLGSRLNHPNWTQVYDRGEHEGAPFVAIEHVPGLDLRSMLSESASLPQPIALYVAAEIAKGLHYIHNLKSDDGAPLHVIFRNLNSKNVLLSSSGEVKIHNVANVHYAKTEIREGVVSGTPAYLSPEQVKGGRLDKRSDLFSFGVLLQEMLTGSRPFQEEGVMQLLMEISRGDPAPLQRGAFPEALRSIVERCLQRDPDLRFGDAGQIHDALGGLSLGGPRDLQAIVRRAVGP